MNKYAEEMQKVALNRLEREILKAPERFMADRLGELLNSGAIRSPYTKALGQQYGTRQMIAQRVAGPNATHIAGWSPNPEWSKAPSAVDRYARGVNSHGPQWDAEHFHALGSEGNLSPKGDYAPIPYGKKGLAAMKAEEKAGKGLAVSEVGTPILNIARTPYRTSSGLYPQRTPYMDDAGTGVHILPVHHVVIPVERPLAPGDNGGALHAIEDSMAARHELFEADASHRGVQTLKGAPLRSLWDAKQVYPHTLSAQGHYGAEVLVREHREMGKNMYRGILPPAPPGQFEAAKGSAKLAYLPIDAVRKIRGEDAIARAASAAGRNPTAEAVARSLGVPVGHLQPKSFLERARSGLKNNINTLQMFSASAKGAAKGSERYRSASPFLDAPRQSTYKDSMP